MHICLLTLSPFIRSSGGGEKVFSLMANHFSEAGHNVTAIILDDTEGEPFFKLSSKVRLVNCGLGYRYHHRINNLKALFSFSKVARKARRNELDIDEKRRRLTYAFKMIPSPDVVITYQALASYLLESTKVYQRPIISMMHLCADEIKRDPMFARFKPALQRCSKVQVLSKNDVSIFEQEIGLNNVQFIPNIVPQFPFKFETQEPTILCVGRIDAHQKRQMLLVEAFSLLAGEFPEWNVKLVGDCKSDLKYANALRQRIQTLKLTDRIILTGTATDIENIMRRSSIFCFPSAFEGFPLAMTEAMSLGLPVVGISGAPGVTELIADGETGLLAEPTPKSIATALRQLLINPDLRTHLGYNAHESMKVYSAESVWGEWDLLIKEIAQ